MAADVTLAFQVKNARKSSREVDGISKSYRGVRKEAKGASAANRAFSSSAKGVGRASVTMAKGLGTLAVVGFGAVAYEIKRATDGYEDHMKVVRSTNAVVKSTGGAAGYSAKQVGALSDSLERKTAVDGDVIQSGANMLLTFKNVQRGVGGNRDMFKRANVDLVDYAAAMKVAPRKAAISLGKALNDPVKGITALSKAGVTFTDVQKKQVAGFVKTGDYASAQAVILKELESEFKGQAKAQATAKDKLLVPIHAIEDAIGSAFLPVKNDVFALATKELYQAQPLVEKMSRSVKRIFGDDSLSLGDKFKLSGASVKHWAAPLVADLGNELEGQDVGPKIGQAFDSAAPFIADHLAAAAPHAAAAFVSAFNNASPWGKLLTAGLLAHKLGGIGKLGALLGVGGMGKTSGIRNKTGPGSLSNPIAVTSIGGGTKGTPAAGATKKGLKEAVKDGVKTGLPWLARAGARSALPVTLAAIPAWLALNNNNDNPTTGMAAANARSGNKPYTPGSDPGQAPKRTTTSARIPGTNQSVEVRPDLGSYPDSHGGSSKFQITLDGRDVYRSNQRAKRRNEVLGMAIHG